jgi:hypothetical protein
MVPLPIAEVIQTLIGWIGIDIIRWLWRSAGEPDGSGRQEYATRCGWCNNAWVVERSQPPADSELPPHWLSAEDSPGEKWCSLRCWVQHWQADPRVAAPPIMAAAPSWPGEWPETDDD